MENSVIGQKIGWHHEKNGGRDQETNGGRHQETNGRSKWRSTPGELKASVTFSTKISAEFNGPTSDPSVEVEPAQEQKEGGEEISEPGTSATAVSPAPKTKSQKKKKAAGKKKKPKKNK